MNANDRNREVYQATGITVTGLPEQYMKDHPEKIIVELNKLHEVSTLKSDESVTYDVEFKFPCLNMGKRKLGNPESEGYFTIDLKAHPKNRKLLELIKFMSEHNLEIDLFGRQYDKRFYVKSFVPRENSELSKEAFFYFLSKIEICFEFPPEVKTEGCLEDAEDNYEFYFKIFREKYPKEIRRYLETHMNERSYEDSVRRFIMMDWSSPTLTLPTANEARKILDNTVYGMDAAKERILEFLEGIRRSGSLAKNLLLLGPPGTGKTTLMQAVAHVLGLPMSIVPMSACADLEAFVGFARTYSGAQEGLVTTALMSPVIETPDGSRDTVHQIAQVLFLNELDKSDADNGHHGSIQSAVLRMADDNRSFFDVYHQIHIDMSNVVIVADANDASKIQKAVLDRFEVIEIPPYTDEEKALIFRRYIFPKVLKEQNVDRSEVSVTKEAVSLIVSSLHSAGIREIKRVANRIVGNYLLHYSWRKSTVHYTPDMVKPFLPLYNIRSTTLGKQPGSVRSAVLVDEIAKVVDIQCLITRAEGWSFHLFGVSNDIMRQELEAAAICATKYLPPSGYHIMVQVYGLNNIAAVGQLGFPVFISVLSAAYHCIFSGVFYGGTTILGGLTSSACDNPDTILSLIDRCGEKRLYTSMGFSKRLAHKHDSEVYEFLDAGIAATLLLEKDV